MSRSEQIYKMVILGSGPAGLATVRGALEAGVAGSEICLLERGERLLAGWRSAALPAPVRPPEVTPWQSAEGPVFDNAWIEALGAAPGLENGFSGPVARVRDELVREYQGAGVYFRTGAKAVEVVRDADGNFRVWFEQGTPLAGKRLVVATGGGRNHAFRWAEEWGLAHTERYPAGLNLRMSMSRGQSWNTLSRAPAAVRLEKLKGAEGLTFSGEITSQHPWLGGSAVSSLSAVCPAALARARYSGDMRVNWLPLVEGGLSPRVISQFQEQAGRRNLVEHPWEGISAALWRFVLKAARVPEETLWRSLTPRQGQVLGSQLTSSRLKFDGFRLDRESGLQAGGIALTSLVAGTFELRKTPGLFWIGEGVDLHALDPVANHWLAQAAGQLAARAACGEA